MHLISFACPPIQAAGTEAAEVRSSVMHLFPDKISVCAITWWATADDSFILSPNAEFCNTPDRLLNLSFKMIKCSLTQHPKSEPQEKR